MTSWFEGEQKLLNNLIGSKMDLIITSGLHKGSYASSLQELGEELIGVDHPTAKGKNLPVSRSAELSIRIENPNGIYHANVAVVRSAVNENIPILWLKLLSPLEKVQRRMFVRVPASIKATAFFLGFKDDIPEPFNGGSPEASAGLNLPPKEWFPVRIADISLGGIGISAKQDVLHFCLEGGRYLLLMKVSDTTMFLVGKIVKISTKKDSAIEMGFAYEGFPVSVEKVLMSYIRHQELLGRGRG
jgi:c-di-GMP-binding flagellar brake protein YcgR